MALNPIAKNSPVMMSEFLDDLNVLNNQTAVTSGRFMNPQELQGLTQGYAKEAGKATIAAKKADIAHKEEMRRMWEAKHEAKKAKKGNMIGTGLSILGTVAGGVMGGPLGASLGGMLSKAFAPKPGGSMISPGQVGSSPFNPGSGGSTFLEKDALGKLPDSLSNAFGMMG